MSYTTIKVTQHLRDRINEQAKARNLTASELVEDLLIREERRRRMQAFGVAIQTADDTYMDEFRVWDGTISDGMHDA